MNNMEFWDKVKRPPVNSLKQIKGGRLSGMTDINPQWRYQVLTEHFGPCGIGWKYTVENKWMVNGADGQIAAFADINLYTKTNETWSDAIPGSGGSMFVSKEKSGLHTSDECYKMAITDALSVASKALGIGADIYAGRWDGSKYKEEKKDVPADENFSIEFIFAEISKALSTTELTNLYNKYKKDINLLPKEDKDAIMTQFKNKKESLA